jgi:hypothetical protein
MARYGARKVKRACETMMSAWQASVAAIALAVLPACAHAQSDLIGAEAFDLGLDLRASVVGGERSWLDGGFGKLREGGDGSGDTAARIDVASIDAAWKPQLGWNFSGLVSVTWQPDVSPNAGLSEAYLRYRSNPAPVRVEARAGVFWPPISLEHEGSNWTVADTITPSAANSWVGEEVKVLGLEGKVESELGEHALALTGAVFAHDDMSGTLLSYRGWALHDVRMATNSDLPLPPLSPSTAPYQSPYTSPFYEVDDRVGFYGRVDWRPPLPVALNAFYYDNRGDRLSSYEMQTSWRTRFWNVGALPRSGRARPPARRSCGATRSSGPIRRGASRSTSTSPPPTCSSRARPARASSACAATGSRRATTASSPTTTTTSTAGPPRWPTRRPCTSMPMCWSS